MDVEVAGIVREVMKQAKEKAGSAERLVKRMSPSLRRSDSTISAYITGDAMPPADVFLEAARAMQINVDDFLYGESLVARLERMQNQLDEMQQWREGQGGPRRP